MGSFEMQLVDIPNYRVCVDERTWKYGNMKHVIVVTFIWCLVCVLNTHANDANAKAINNGIAYSLAIYHFRNVMLLYIIVSICVLCV